MTQGTVKVGLYIRSLPSTSGAKIGGLNAGDIVTGFVTNDWMKLETCTRNGVPVTLPAHDCYASVGANQEYIRLETVTPPPGDDAVVQVVHEITVDGITYAPASGNPITFIKKA